MNAEAIQEGLDRLGLEAAREIDGEQLAFIEKMIAVAAQTKSPEAKLAAYLLATVASGGSRALGRLCGAMVPFCEEEQRRNTEKLFAKQKGGAVS